MLSYLIVASLPVGAVVGKRAAWVRAELEQEEVAEALA